MRRRYVVDHTNLLVLAADVLAVAGAFFTAWMMRARFQFFLYELIYAALILPWLALARILVILFYEHYAVKVRSLTNRDIARLFIHGLIPTAALLVLRLASPIDWLRVPISMIGAEYMLSHFGFSVIRFVAAGRRQPSDGDGLGYRRRIVIWGEVADVRMQGSAATLERTNRVSIRALLTPNPLFWDTDWDGVRVFGDAASLRALLVEDSGISMVCVAAPATLTWRQYSQLVSSAVPLGLEFGVLVQSTVHLVSKAQLEAAALAPGDISAPWRKGHEAR